MRIAVILGTRPEIIKMAPVVRALDDKNADHFILHTGQHYSYNLDQSFFATLKLPSARYNLEVGSGRHGQQTARIITGVEDILIGEKVDVVLVEGDTNSVLAGAIAASKIGVAVGHVEAGLRSYDRSMPEETNRILTDHCADYLFAPTETAQNILLGEGIPDSRIYVTGNTIVDAVYQNLEIAESSTDVLHELGISSEKYLLVTVHRQENVDDRARLTSIFRGLDMVSRESGMPIIFPVHPHTTRRMDEYKLTSRSLKFIDPVDYMSFLQLEKNAALILTDSGGVQEESCILGVPCVTLRDNTERPETIEAGSNLLAGTDPADIVECAGTMLNKIRSWENPFGDGKSGARIVDIIMEEDDG